MKVTLTPISEVRPYLKNAKEHGNKQVSKIADSIKEFGFNQPIVVDKEGVIIVGHGRLLAAQQLHLEEVPVLVLDIPEEKAKAYRLADNKLNESEWDMDIVISELKTLSETMINLTGFDANLVLETKEDKPDLGGIGEPKSKEGDLYEFGAHRLICGDSTKAETYERLLGGDKKPRLIFTDPPYSIDYEAGLGMSDSKKKFNGTGGKIKNDDKTPAEALLFYKEILEQMHKFSSDDVTIYWWFAPRLTDVSMQAFRETKWHYSQIVVWLKNSLIYSPHQRFHRVYEPCMVGWKDGKVSYQNMVFSQYSELWTLEQKKFADYLDMWYQKRDPVKNYIHPTQKPVQLAERAIKRSSEKGDVVLDAFGGSGSTLMACEQLNRSARLIELDPQYVDAIISRWCKYTENTHVIKNGKEILW